MHRLTRPNGTVLQYTGCCFAICIAIHSNATAIDLHMHQTLTFIQNFTWLVLEFVCRRWRKISMPSGLRSTWTVASKICRHHPGLLEPISLNARSRFSLHNAEFLAKLLYYEFRECTRDNGHFTVVPTGWNDPFHESDHRCNFAICPWRTIILLVAEQQRWSKAVVSFNGSCFRGRIGECN